MAKLSHTDESRRRRRKRNKKMKVAEELIDSWLNYLSPCQSQRVMSWLNTSSQITREKSWLTVRDTQLTEDEEDELKGRLWEKEEIKSAAAAAAAAITTAASASTTTTTTTATTAAATKTIATSTTATATASAATTAASMTITGKTEKRTRCS